MNFQNPTVNPAKLPVDVPLVKRLLIRLMTRNQRDRVQAMLDRQILERNLESLNTAPEAHLGTVLQIIDKMTREGRFPVFETGLIFGVSMTLCARSVNGKQMLNRMLSDIARQQDTETPDQKAVRLCDEVIAWFTNQVVNELANQSQGAKS